MPQARNLLVLGLVPIVLLGLAGGPASGSRSDAGRVAPRPVRIGAYVEGLPADPASLARFEDLVGVHAGIASYYYGFGDVFPGPTERALAANGTRTVLLSWDMGDTRFRQWTRGLHDDYLHQIVTAARAYPYAVYVRPWPEMNGDWQEFQPTPAGDRPRGGTYPQFVAAWRHVVTYVREHGAGNIRWVFNPSADTYAGTTPVRKIWPGSRYVDVLGVDGYNWGADASWGRWRSFREVFGPMYRILTSLDAHAPVWVCEFGSKDPTVDDGAPADPSHSKRSWLHGALTQTTMPRIRALVFFSTRKERDWRVDSSPGALAAVRQALDGS